MFLQDFIDNFQTFPILGIVVVFGAITAIGEQTGMFATTIKLSVSKLNGTAIVFAVALVSVLSRAAGDICQILMPILAATLFYEIGRHPLAGAFCAFAASSAGFAASLIPASGDLVMTDITISSAQILIPDFDLSVLASFFALFTSGIVIAIVTTVITIKVVEPRLGTYTGTPEGETLSKDAEVSDLERAAAKKAGIAALIYLLLLVVACIPSNSFFRSETGSLVYDSLLMNSISVLIALLFFIPEVVYGVAVGKIKKGKDIIEYMAEGVRSLAGFIAMAIVIGQFLRIFSMSNIGTLVGIKGGELLSKSSLPPQLIVVLFILLVALINLLMSSQMTKYLILGPVFVPMLMQLNIHPAFTQWIYRMGDGITNLITPLDVVFIMMLSTCQKYDKDAGMGTMFTYLLPYSIAYYICLAILAVLWMTLGIDLGFGGHVWLN